MEKKKHRKIKTNIKLISLIIILVLLVILTISLTISLKDEETVTSTTYQNTGQLTPSICLKNNDFIEATCSEENKSYVNSLINNINVTLNASLLASNILSTTTYQYNIEAEVIANEKGDTSKIVYDNTEAIDSGSFSNKDKTGFSLTKTVNIDFQKYNQIITDFKRNYVLALDSKLLVKATITSDSIIKETNNSINSDKTIYIIIPLSEQTVNLTLDNATYNEQDTKVETIQNDNFFQRKNIITILYIIDSIFIAFALIYIIKLIPKKDQYKAKLDKITKEYDRAIAITKNIPSFKGLKIIHIDSFEELLDVKDNLDKPILLHENKTISSATFFIITSHEAYIYTLNAYEE